MSRKISFIIVGVLILILLGIVIAAFIIAPRQDKTTVEVLRDFVPFGRGGESLDTPRGSEEGNAVQQGEGGQVSEEGVPQLEGEHSGLVQLSNVPVVGIGFYSIGTSTEVIRYLEQTSGNVFEINPKTLEKRRLTNTTILGIKNVIWSDDPNTLLIQYLDNRTIKTLLAHITGLGSTTPGTLSGEFLEEGIETITSSPTRDRVFYSMPFGQISVGTIFNLQNETKKQIFSHPLKEWLVSWPQESKILLTTKPSGVILGYSFTVTSTTGTISPFISGVSGLTVNPSPSLNKALYADSFSDSPMRITLYDTKTKGSLVFPLSTLPEKCVWTQNEDVVYCAVPKVIPQGVYPDSWYTGEISFNDSLWRLDLTSGSVSEIIQLDTLIGEHVDVINLTINPQEDYLVFQDKKSGTLWRLEIK